MKQYTPLQFVELAKSKDQTRYICSVYRDTEKLVATDGHRLHYTNGLEKIEKPHFIDGNTGEFPDYVQVLPKNSPIVTFELWTNAIDLKKLSGIKTIIDTYDKKDCCIAIEKTENQILITNAYGAQSISVSYTLPLAPDASKKAMPKIGINLNYLLDVIKAVATMPMGRQNIDVRFHGELSPLELVTSLGTAIIMPINLDRK